MANHWWVGGILSTIIVYSGYVALTIILNYPVRIIKSLTIMIRGWPPSHLDVDGNWRHKDDDKNVG